MNMKKGKKQPRTPDIMRKGGPMRDKTKYTRKKKHRVKVAGGAHARLSH